MASGNGGITPIAAIAFVVFWGILITKWEGTYFHWLAVAAIIVVVIVMASKGMHR